MDVLTENSLNKTRPGTSVTAKILIGLTGGVGLGLTIICGSFVAPAFRRFCLPYLPASTQQVANVLSLIPKNGKGKLLDIGSGDGRIVIAAANHGIESHGVELNSWLVIYSKLLALKNRYPQPVKFYRKDLWKFDIKPYNYIVIFGVEQMMNDLEKKLIKEGLPNSKIIACRFPLPSLQSIKIIGQGVDTVWLYEIPKVQSTIATTA